MFLPHRDDYTFKEEEQVLLDLEEQDYENRLLDIQEADIQERSIDTMGMFAPITEEGIESPETSTEVTKVESKEEKDQ